MEQHHSDSAPNGPAAQLLHLHPEDNVGVATGPLTVGQKMQSGPWSVTVAAPVGLGHKLALRDILEGESILKYGAPIGYATQPIPAGAHVHLHNLASRYTVIEDIEGTNA